jgi:hypothetical protein
MNRTRTRTRTRIRAFAAAATLAAGLGALAGCGGGDAAPARFDDQAAAERPPTCLVHQQAGPGPEYTDRAAADTGQVLAVLLYYVANGSKPYCDGNGPTEADRAWVRLYMDLGADPARVKRITG